MKKTAGKETPSKETSGRESPTKAATSKEAPKEVSKEKSKAKPAEAEEAAPTGPRAKMTKPELKFFENLLNEKKETLLQELGYLEDNTMRLNSKEGAGDLSSHAYHLADHATETQDREQAFHMASREGKYLFYIEEALDRVRNGTFGVCKKCGKLIPKPRLEAVPTAKMCIDCKTKQEKAAEAASVG
ncbi:MAG: polymerase-binding protein DksA [Fibrobacteres bacterium]|nr:polymerase-binding protein DksA [Fibrobacterota bacterium]